MSVVIKYYHMFTVENETKQEIFTLSKTAIVNLMKERNSFVLFLDIHTYSLSKSKETLLDRSVYRLKDVLELEENHFKEKLSDYTSKKQVEDLLIRI